MASRVQHSMSSNAGLQDGGAVMTLDDSATEGRAFVDMPDKLDDDDNGGGGGGGGGDDSKRKPRTARNKCRRLCSGGTSASRSKKTCCTSQTFITWFMCSMLFFLCVISAVFYFSVYQVTQVIDSNQLKGMLADPMGTAITPAGKANVVSTIENLTAMAKDSRKSSRKLNRIIANLATLFKDDGSTGSADGEEM